MSGNEGAEPVHVALHHNSQFTWSLVAICGMRR